MNYIKRAALSLGSRKGRTLIMFGAFLVISAMVLGGVLIKSATDQAGQAAKRRVGAEVDLAPDLSALAGGGGGQFTAPQIGVDTVDRIGRSPLVAGYNYQSFDGTRLLGGARTISDEPLYPDAPANYTLVHGVLDSSLLPGFSDGTWRLLSGGQITAADKDRDVVLVEERLARKNGLKVGDTLTLTQNDPAGHRKADFTVKGVYRDPSDRPDPEFQQLPGDRMIIPAQALARLNADGKPGTGDAGAPARVGSATFRLKDPETFDAFKAAAEKTAGQALDGFSLGINDKAVRQMTGPLHAIASSATTAMWLTGAAGAAVLGLLAALAVKQRRREFGILLAMGESKWKLVAQQAVEVLAVAALATALSAVFAEGLTQRAGDALLGDEAAAAQRRIDSWKPPPPGSTGLDQGIDPGDEPVENADPVDDITVRLDPAALATVAGVGLGIGLLATVAPATSVVRLNPRTILTKGK